MAFHYLMGNWYLLPGDNGPIQCLWNMEFSANSCLEICKSSAELVIKIQEFKDLERRGRGLSSLKLQKLTMSAGPSFQPRRLRATQLRVVGDVTVAQGAPDCGVGAGWVEGSCPNVQKWELRAWYRGRQRLWNDCVWLHAFLNLIFCIGKVVCVWVHVCMYVWGGMCVDAHACTSIQ